MLRVSSKATSTLAVAGRNAPGKMMHMELDAQALDRRILAFIESNGGSEDFERLALDLFAYQYDHNAVYRAYCDQVLEGQGGVARGGDECGCGEPGRPRPRLLPRTWRDIPAVWPVAWRLTDLCCFDPRQAVAAFRSSGTTGGSSHGRGRHLFDTLTLYEAAFAGPFAAALLPFGVRRLVPALDRQKTSQSGGVATFSGGAGYPRFPMRNGQETPYGVTTNGPVRSVPVRAFFAPPENVATPQSGDKSPQPKEAPLPQASDSSVPILVLMPSPDESPDSSLSFMMGLAIARFGLPEASGFFVHDGRFLLDEFVAAIEAMTQSGNPVVVASTAFGWVTLLEWLGERKLPLPAGSRVMETGGYKGRTAEWPRVELYARLSSVFAVPDESIVSEYGMCELSSQFYSGGRGSGVGGQESGSDSFSPTTEGRGVPAGDRERGVIFHGPSWVRVLAIDPETQLPVPPGEAGLLRVIDLANRGSCIAVQTEDLAIIRGDSSFELLGRAPSAPPKGCSLTAEDQGLVASG